ncbi:MAG: enoyl-CoA hydratase-related protein [Syntrophales bacterium]|nr:enoyl-CoA hydratase-related protein [Syntrophales bacterium]
MKSVDKEEVILFEKKDKVAVLSFNRPQALNALNIGVNLRLIALLLLAEADPEIKVVVLTGAGKAFVAGGDIKEMYSMNAMEARAYALQAKRVTDTIWNLGIPVIAAINGLCLGGGIEYAMACDLRTASETAKFGQPEINIGIMPGSAGTQRLPRLIGMTKAKEFCFTGAMFDAKTALELGLVNYVYPTASLMEETLALAGQIASKSTPALRLIKSSINRGMDTDMETGSLFEIDCFGLCFSTQEQKDAMRAFVEKSKK